LINIHLFKPVLENTISKHDVTLNCVSNLLYLNFDMYSMLIERRL